MMYLIELTKRMINCTMYMLHLVWIDQATVDHIPMHIDFKSNGDVAYSTYILQITKWKRNLSNRHI